MHRRDLLKIGPLALIGSLLGIKQADAALPVADNTDHAYVETRVIYRDRLYFDPDFEPWYGPDGTRFRMEPLARTKDSLDYFLVAEPAGWYENSYKFWYRRLEFSATEIVALSVEKVHKMIEDEKTLFEHWYYSMPLRVRSEVDEGRKQRWESLTIDNT